MSFPHRIHITSDEMKAQLAEAEMRLPKAFLALVGVEDNAVLCYPKAGADEERQATWLVQKSEGWHWSTYNQSPLPVLRRLVFQRWLHRQDFVARGGRLP